jgi:hypothetical protein
MTKTAPERDEIAGIVDFLCGAAPDWQGRWFDEASRQERGSFWWRTYVRQIERIAAKDRAEALAAQGALLEKVATILTSEGEKADDAPFSEGGYGYFASQIEEAVLALSPDATTALAEIRREAVEQERERCATIVEKMSDKYRDDFPAPEEIAAAIRENDE